MASDEVQLLSSWVSSYGMRVEVALSSKGVPYSVLPQDPFNKSPLLLQSNPVHKKIPVLLHHGKCVCESLVIVQYVDEAFPSPDGEDLLPKDPYDRAIARFWADFIDKKISECLMRLWKTTGDEQNAAKVELKEHLNTLEEAFGTVPKEPPYFGGANVGLVDVILSPLVAWYDAVETLCKFEFEFEKRPGLARWMKAMRGSPGGKILPEPQKITEFITMMIQKRRPNAEAEAQAQALVDKR